MNKLLLSVLIVSLFSACSRDGFVSDDLGAMDHLEPWKTTTFLPRSEGIDYDLWIENESLSAADFHKKYQHEFEVSNIHLRFEKEQLTTEDGKIYQPFSWNSNLERELTLTTHDHFKSTTIIEAYRRHIFPVLYEDPDLNKKFLWFIFKYHMYFGSELTFVKKKLSLYSEFDSFFLKMAHIRAFGNFVDDIAASFPKPNHVKDGTKKIAIISGPYGGGHGSSATVLESTIRKSGKYEVLKLDECLDFPDTLFLLTQHKNKNGSTSGYHSCKIYNDITIGEGNIRKATLLYILNNKLSNYRPLNRYHDLYKKLHEENVDLIISTVHHLEEITGNAYLLDIPMRIMITDYEFPKKQWFHLNHIDSALVKYWSPTEDHPGFFRSFIRDYVTKSWDTIRSGTRSNTIKTMVMADRPLKEILESTDAFEFMPLPVSPLITPPSNREDVSASRGHPDMGLTVQEDRKVVTIALGGTPNLASLTKSIQQLIRISPQLNNRIQIAVVTAGRDPIIQGVSEVFDQYQIPVLNPSDPTSEGEAPITARVFGYLRYPDQMALLYKASSVMISKSGGATTAELINSRTPFIRGFALWPWEIENTKYLEALRLSASNTPHASNLIEEDLSLYQTDTQDEDLVVQLNQIFKTNERPEIAVPKFSETRLFQVLENALGSYQQFSTRTARKLSRLWEVSNQINNDISLKGSDNSLHFDLLETIPFSSGRDAEIYHLERKEDQSHWALKVLKSFSISVFRSGSPIDMEHQTMQRLKELAPQNVPDSIYVSKFALMKEFIEGDTLFQMLKDGKMTPEISEKLYELFRNFCRMKVYVRDLHGYNLIYRKDQANWVVIDTNGIVENVPDPSASYYAELLTHWEPEMNPNDPRYDRSRSEETRQRLEKIREILLDRLKRRD